MKNNRLTRTQVRELLSHYKSLVWKKRGIFPDGKGDASSIWFDLQSIKEFISEIDSHNVNMAVDEKDKISGIRFYYGAYPKDFPNVDPRYTDRHTLVWVATFAERNGKQNCDDEGNEVGWGRIDAMNHGFPCPPDCGTGGGGFGEGIYYKTTQLEEETL
jgi:hypothetical protein